MWQILYKLTLPSPTYTFSAAMRGDSNTRVKIVLTKMLRQRSPKAL